MQVSATSRHCEKNGWGGVFEEKWEHYKTGSPMGGSHWVHPVGKAWRRLWQLPASLAVCQWTSATPFLSYLDFWTSAIVNKIYLSGVYEQVTFSNLFTVTPGTIKTGIPMLWLPGRLSDMDWSPALTPDPPLGDKVLMARATMVAYYTASSCDLRAAWTYKGKRLTEAGGGVGERRQERGYPREQPGFAHWQRQQIHFE